MITMDKKILNALQRLYQANNKFYEAHDISLKEKEELDVMLNRIERRMLETDIKYDEKKEKKRMAYA